MPVTDYGFTWGPLEVTRAISDPKFGYVIDIRTPYGWVEVRCAPTGRKLTTRSGTGKTQSIQDGK